MAQLPRPATSHVANLLTIPYELRLEIYSYIFIPQEIPIKLNTSTQILTLFPELQAQKLLSLLLTCHQTYNETHTLLYSSPTFIFTTLASLKRLLTALPPTTIKHIRTIHAIIPFAHLPNFSSCPPPRPLSPSSEITPPSIPWHETLTSLSSFPSLKLLYLEPDIPLFWRHAWRAREAMMLSSVSTYLKEQNGEVRVGVAWDVESEDGFLVRKRFGEGIVNGNGGKGKWSVERVGREGEEGNLWEREWGYLVDLGLSG